MKVNITMSEGKGTSCRCLCGSLLARRVPEGVELKCRRCRRVVVLPLIEGEDDRAAEVVIAEKKQTASDRS